MKRVSERLDPYEYGSTTLVATSLCCDEVNRPLEKALAKQYDKKLKEFNFILFIFLLLLLFSTFLYFSSFTIWI
jgi:hypothetical protein